MSFDGLFNTSIVKNKVRGVFLNLTSDNSESKCAIKGGNAEEDYVKDTFSLSFSL